MGFRSGTVKLTYSVPSNGKMRLEPRFSGVIGLPSFSRPSLQIRTGSYQSFISSLTLSGSPGHFPYSKWWILRRTLNRATGTCFGCGAWDTKDKKAPSGNFLPPKSGSRTESIRDNHFLKYFSGSGFFSSSPCQKIVTIHQRLPSFINWMLLMPRANGFASPGACLES